jgi:bifunctional non-homologous end joining protein LigD
MVTIMIKESITLYFKEGSSDKYYTISIEEKDGKYTVPFVYGRRGDAGQTGNKASKPLDYDKAKKMFDKVVSEKRSKGYTEGEGMKPYSGTISEKKVSGLLCQLLNPISEEECNKLLKDDDWGAQEKFDGKRMLLKKEGNKITAINRKGLECGFPSEVEEQLLKIKADFIIDGEMIGTNYYCFDMLSLNGENFKNNTYSFRHCALYILKNNLNKDNIHIAPLSTITSEKKKLFKSLKNKEGIVFKKLDSKYTPGRPASNGDQRKYKFYSTASVIVIGHNDKNSISIGVMDKDKIIPIGNVTMNGHKIPLVNSIIEVKYLYFFPGGSLYQPSFLNVRDDLDKNDCILKQLKYKFTENE